MRINEGRKKPGNEFSLKLSKSFKLNEVRAQFLTNFRYPTFRSVFMFIKISCLNIKRFQRFLIAKTLKLYKIY